MLVEIIERDGKGVKQSYIQTGIGFEGIFPLFIFVAKRTFLRSFEVAAGRAE
jgi:hypothetical protein